ncbi:MAG: type II toxin-antitoxin system RelE/ParE family toxin [Proteobacteria bacterium]|nr:type II toxin-antitoxin system RelE/ParE family toxin [Pseudomonadota bacterium]
MAWTIIWTQSAWNDLEAAADYISKDSPRYAASFVQEVCDAVRSLNALAFRGRVVPEFDDTNIRELLLKSYRLIYQVTAQKIYILGLIHGARDLWVLWKKENR